MTTAINLRGSAYEFMQDALMTRPIVYSEKVLDACFSMKEFFYNTVIVKNLKKFLNIDETCHYKLYEFPIKHTKRHEFINLVNYELNEFSMTHTQYAFFEYLINANKLDHQIVAYHIFPFEQILHMEEYSRYKSATEEACVEFTSILFLIENNFTTINEYQEFVLNWQKEYGVIELSDVKSDGMVKYQRSYYDKIYNRSTKLNAETFKMRENIMEIANEKRSLYELQNKQKLLKINTVYTDSCEIINYKPLNVNVNNIMTSPTNIFDIVSFEQRKEITNLLKNNQDSELLKINFYKYICDTKELNNKMIQFNFYTGSIVKGFIIFKTTILRIHEFIKKRGILSECIEEFAPLAFLIQNGYTTITEFKDFILNYNNYSGYKTMKEVKEYLLNCDTFESDKAIQNICLDGSSFYKKYPNDIFITFFKYGYREGLNELREKQFELWGEIYSDGFEFTNIINANNKTYGKICYVKIPNDAYVYIDNNSFTSFRTNKIEIIKIFDTHHDFVEFAYRNLLVKSDNDTESLVNFCYSALNFLPEDKINSKLILNSIGNYLQREENDPVCNVIEMFLHDKKEDIVWNALKDNNRDILKSNYLLLKDNFKLSVETEIEQLFEFVKDKPEYCIGGGYIAIQYYEQDFWQYPDSDIDVYILQKNNDTRKFRKNVEDMIVFLNSTYGIEKITSKTKCSTCSKTSVIDIKLLRFHRSIQLIGYASDSIAQLMNNTDTSHSKCCYWNGHTYITYDTKYTKETGVAYFYYNFHQISRLNKVRKLGLRIYHKPSYEIKKINPNLSQNPIDTDYVTKIFKATDNWTAYLNTSIMSLDNTNVQLPKIEEITENDIIINNEYVMLSTSRMYFDLPRYNLLDKHNNLFFFSNGNCKKHDEIEENNIVEMNLELLMNILKKIISLVNNIDSNNINLKEYINNTISNNNYIIKQTTDVNHYNFIPIQHISLKNNEFYTLCVVPLIYINDDKITQIKLTVESIGEKTII
jgi:hypothetical protein